MDLAYFEQLVKVADPGEWEVTTREKPTGEGRTFIVHVITTKPFRVGPPRDIVALPKEHRAMAAALGNRDVCEPIVETMGVLEGMTEGIDRWHAIATYVALACNTAPSLMQQVKAKDARIARLVALLRDLQFDNDQDECKVCYAQNPAHLSSCRLAKEIGEGW